LDVGDPCDDGSDCPSNFCIEVPGRATKVCTDYCNGAGDCPADWTCAAVSNSGADITFLCFPQTNVLCTSCEADSDCGGLSDRCLDLNDGRFCGRNCALRDCPDGFECVEMTVDGQADPVQQCMPSTRYCSDCYDPDNDGYGVGEGCAGYDCDETDPQRNAGATEVCDAIDNDCDDLVDEDFDLMSDVENCNGCNQRCVLPGAIEACVEGVCVVADCEPDRYDYDPAQEGCEYSCTITEGGTELCDGVDNNCDGTADEGLVTGSDPTNCRFCGDVCSFGNAAATCVDFQCVRGVCDRFFWDVDDNPNDCEYACIPTGDGTERCDDNDNDCDGQVDEDFDLMNDPANCGRCGHVCEPVPSGTIACVEGSCVVESCVGDTQDCNEGQPGGYADGCETGLYDPSACLRCDNLCTFTHGVAGCNANGCLMVGCEENYWDLRNGSTDGCEYYCVPSNNGVEVCDERDNDCDGDIDEDFDLQRDEANCGQCNHACADVPNATEVCTDGTCRIDQCDANSLNCDPNAPDGGFANGCESSRTSPNTCLSCDTRCAYDHATPGCNASGCFLARCDDNYWNIRNGDADGCEYLCIFQGANEVCNSADDNCNGAIDEGFDLQNDATHCGQCNRVCGITQGTPYCNAGDCDLLRCNTNWDNCDSATDPAGQVNGCETYLPEDENHCGRCGRVCNLPNSNEICLTGECQVESCQGTWRDCDDLPVTGCEQDINAIDNLDHCGGCNQACNFDHASEYCDVGRCTFAQCDGNYWNLDNNLNNGCEYYCTGSANASDVPDTAGPGGTGVDNNCDGIDGDADRSIYVATPANGGNNNNDGRTRQHPVATITRGIEIADTCSPKCDVLVSGGTYTESLTLRSGVDVFGGYAVSTWTRNVSNNTTTLNANAYRGVVASGLNAVTVFDGLTVVGLDRTDASGTSYAFWVNSVASNRLVIRNAIIEAGDGGPGDPGGDGTVGATGDSGSATTGRTGAGGGANTTCSANGGDGGTSYNCGSGGGGDGANGGSGTAVGGGGAAGGNRCGGGCNDSASGGSGGGSGDPGTGGTAATAASDTDGAFDASGLWGGVNGNGGNAGKHGGGGGGGGSGGTDVDDWYCVGFSGTEIGGGGGGGGAGGCGGGAGGAGNAGGASLGIVAINSTITVESTTIRRGTGGRGGNGGKGAGGGRGQSGGAGFNPSNDEGGTGAAGGSGGDGGGGSGGAGGNGGASIGIATVNSTVTTTSVSTPNGVGAGGGAGTGGTGGTEGNRTGTTRAPSGANGNAGAYAATRAF